ncbi:MAG: type ISP restriction/modification enzyme [Nitrospirota bacterium]
MRRKLLESFNETYILNLHGNSRIGEKCPDGSPDENVFDIMQGVSIALFVKSRKQKGLGKVFYQDVYSLREKKYEYLNKHDIKSTKWIRLQPSEPYYFFVKKDFSLQARYDKFWSIQDIFIKSSSGVKTHRDHFVVGFTKEEIMQRMRTFTSDLPDDLVRQGLNLKDTHDFKLKEVRERLRKEDWKDSILPYSYRPFDNRYICYRPELIDRDRFEVMHHFYQDNIGICVTRQLSTPDFLHAFVTNNVADICSVSIKTRETGYIFPLYLYTKRDNPTKKHSLKTFMLLFEPQADYFVRKPNLSEVLIDKLTKTLKKSLTPEQIFFYIYSILYSNIYRTKYAEFLKIDFPRVPFTKDYKLFSKMAELGEKLVDLHLMKSSELDPPVAKLQGKGDNKVEKLKYDDKERHLYVNQNQYFKGITKEVWQYQIGGYRVCDKWLKDRKGRRLSLDDIKHYCKIITSLQKTIKIQKVIDNIYPEVEKETVEF